VASDVDEIRLAELLAGLEGLVEHRARQQVAHLDADERLPAARRRFRDVDVDDVRRCVLVFEEHLSLDVDGFDQAAHLDSVAAMASLQDRESRS
jgi:hypothetical protein